MKWKRISPRPVYSYVNGNHVVRLYSDGTKVKETLDSNDDHFTYEFPESFDLKITDYCDAGCPYCHENSTVRGRHADLEAVMPTLLTMHPGSEIAIGGGNALEHPYLKTMVDVLGRNGIICSITVNQRHLQKFKADILELTHTRNFGGVGVSLVDSGNEADFAILDGLGQNVVIHVIAGVLKPEDYHRLYGRKILILGYKDMRRGHDNLVRHSEEIQKNIEQLKKDLPSLEKRCASISFDCLGLKQLNPKETLGMDDVSFEMIYQGDDYDMFDVDGNLTVSTLFVDAVNMKVSRSSTSAMDKRYAFVGNEDVSELLVRSCSGY